MCIGKNRTMSNKLLVGISSKVVSGLIFIVLIALMSNGAAAAKYTESGTMTIRTIPQNKGMEIVVEDTGVGISVWLPLAKTTV